MRVKLFPLRRYFSEDKKSYAKITAKNGRFIAEYENVSPEQNRDVDFEIAFQFLLNLRPNEKTVLLKGSPEDVHSMRAAFFSLTKRRRPLCTFRFCIASRSDPCSR